MPMRRTTARMQTASGRLSFLLALLVLSACQTLGGGAEESLPEPTVEAERAAEAEAAAARVVEDARAALELPDPRSALSRLVALDRGLPSTLQEEARSLAREAVEALPPSEVEEVAGDLPPETAVAGVILARQARIQASRGEDEAARATARSALDAGATGPDSVVAARLLDPDAEPLTPLEGVTRIARIAGVLPTSGSPALQEFARLVAEGIEVAAVAHGDRGTSFEVLSRDDEGDPARAAQAVRSLQEAGALGAVGFIQDEALAAGAEARSGPLPLISPTARNAQAVGEGAYSLAGPDPVAAASVAEWTADQGYARVAILHSQDPESVEEADAVEEVLRSRGIPVVGRESYPARATFFQDPIRAAREVLRLQEIRSLGLGPDDTLFVEELDPVALVVPIPTEDVEYVAPQLTFFGLDTLGIDVIGTSGWTAPQTFEVVDDRHLDGVVATAPVNAGPGSAGYDRFRQAYEEHLQRTLVSSVPALGYDAALLLLDAVERGGGTAAAVERALASTDGLEGATGVFSVVDGRILRRQEVVRIVNGGTIPAP